LFFFVIYDLIVIIDLLEIYRYVRRESIYKGKN